MWEILPVFFVKDNQCRRHQKVLSFIKTEPAIAVLLSAADFEWTIRRAIIALGTRPNVEIRETTLRNCNGLDKYKNAWKVEVQPVHEVKLTQVIPNWGFFRTEAFPLRHKLIHGVIGTVSKDYAAERVESVLTASQAIFQFALSRDCDLYARLKVRRRTASS